MYAEISLENLNKIVDCITNLEQMYNDTKDTYNEICAEQVDYKSRNEKAIEYINSRINTLNIISYEDIINILKGSDEE